MLLYGRRATYSIPKGAIKIHEQIKRAAKQTNSGGHACLSNSWLKAQNVLFERVGPAYILLLPLFIQPAENIDPIESNTTNHNIKQLFIAPRVVIPVEFNVDPARKLVPLMGFPDILTILN
jgi:hypothetical protein